MSDTRDKIKKVLEDTTVDNVIKKKHFEQLADELVSELVPQEKENALLHLIGSLEGPVDIPVFNNRRQRIGVAEVIDGHFKVAIYDKDWTLGRTLHGVSIFVDWGRE